MLFFYKNNNNNCNFKDNFEGHFTLGAFYLTQNPNENDEITKN
jgi:hypothetical protein